MLFENLAKWSDRTVTGVASTVQFCPVEEKKNEDGTAKPDYTFNGDLMEARPGKKATVLWKRIVDNGYEGSTIDPNQPY